MRSMERLLETAVIEQCPDTGLYVGYVPGFPGVHSQGQTVEELRANLREIISMLGEDEEPLRAYGRERFRRALDKVADVEPEEQDRL